MTQYFRLSFRLLQYGTAFFFTLFFFYGTFAQPIAKFTADTTKICAPVVVQFKDLSSGSPTSWLWDFGNGNTSTVQHPGAFYVKPGVYTVTLIVSNTKGTDTLIKPYYISAYSTPLSDFSAKDTVGCLPFTAKFTDKSLPLSGTITSWFWNFGDGAYSTSPSPSHAYTVAGKYKVSLIAKDANGCQSYLMKNEYISVRNPKADFNYSSVACPVPATTYFTNTSIGDGLSYSWNFGDGETSALKHPSHTFSGIDTFDVKLKITDGICSDSTVKQMKTLALKANFDYSVACSPTEFTISFTDKTTPVPSEWYWEFGDGDNSQKQNPSHTYLKFYPYTITLVVKMGNGCSDTMRKTYIPPAADFTADSFSCKSPFPVAFNNLSQGTDSLNYLWNFDDGGTSALKNPSHTFIVPKGVYIDTFNVVLEVRNKFGCKNKIQDPIVVRKPYSKFASDTSGCVPLDIQFTDKSISTDSITKWNWNFGDASTSALQNPLHTYKDTGKFTVSLITTTAKGCSDTLVKTKYIIAGIKPDFIDFTSYDTTCYHNQYFFSDLSKYNDGKTKPNNWKWYFGYRFSTGKCEGDSFINVKDPMFDTGHLPVGIGEDTILFISGYNQCYDTISKTLINVPPRTKISYYFPDSTLADKTSMYSCSAPVTLGFSNASDGYSTVPKFYMKNKQTGVITNLDTNPNAINFLIFNKAGNYLFYMETHNDTTHTGGCTDINPHYMLTVDSVTRGFTMVPKSVCRKGNAFTFKDTSKSFYGEIIRWKWNFGDGDTLANDTITEVVYYDTVKTALKGTDTIKTVHNHFKHTSGTYKTPVHTYRDTGTYTVTLTLTTNVLYWCCGNGGFYNGVDIYDTSQCNYIITDTVRVHDVYAGFQAGTTASCPGTAITFSDTSSTKIVSRKWYWGDGTAADTAKIQKHTYSQPGIYDVALVVSNSAGCKDSLTLKKYISVTVPVADFSTKTSACYGDTLSFQNKSSGNILSCLWDFGDGTTDTLPAPSHAYKNTGSYALTLTVTDTNGCKNTKKQMNYITVNIKPKAGFKADTLAGKCPPVPIVFTDTSSQDAVKWEWNFGDGQISTLKNPSHYFTSSGDFDVSLTVSNTKGCADKITKTGYIKVNGPNGSFSFSPDTNCVPFKATFIAGSSETDMYFWDFGDGNVSFVSAQNRGDSVSHIYTTAGEYTPILILKDSLHCVYTVPSVKKVSADGATVGFDFGDSIHCSMNRVLFSNLTKSILPVSGYLWNFGDGDTASAESPVHLYDSAGTYNVTLTTTGITGCISLYTKKIIMHKAPDLSVQVDGKECKPLFLKLIADNNDASVTVDSWQWKTPDTVINSNPAFFTFASTGKKNVVLTAVYSGGICKIDSVLPVYSYGLLQGDFTYSPAAPSVHNPTVKFTDRSASATSWLWKFGTGDTSSLKNPSFTYKTPGEYTVTLLVSNSNGCSDTVVKKLYIASKSFVKVPSAFTPNGDGNNDNIVLYHGGIVSLTSFQIYNRWGEKVYETADLNEATTKGWDGNYKGFPQNTDSYSYYIIAQTVDLQEPLVQKGTFTLIR